jgi:hypothetical protein
VALERFQEATAQAAIAALGASGGSGRFLIADEVGLGKTVVSRALAEHLGKGRRKPLNVVYLCSNLNIASQNLTKFKALDKNWGTPEDRLSLVCKSPAQTDGLAFRIFSFTPDTSLPGWKRSTRTGRVAERKLIADLLAQVAPALLEDLMARDQRRRAASRGAKARPLWPEGPIQRHAHLERPFSDALRLVFDLKGKPLERGLLAWLKRRDDPAEFILRARSALSLVALQNPATRPDLLILDEFHRYADLILPRPVSPANEVEIERRAVYQRLVDALLDKARPVLLLSATPYRLTRADGGAVPGSRYAHLQHLIRFLYGADQAAANLAAERLGAYHAALARHTDRDAAVTEVLRSKSELEAILRPIMARTERATSLEGELFKKERLETSVRRDDLDVFGHFARAVHHRAPRLNSWVQPLWTSVPYPAETLFDYVVAKGLGGRLPVTNSSEQRNGPAHPQLRALVTPQDHDGRAKSPPIIDEQHLRLPWLPPTHPWWKLGGLWKPRAGQPPPGKALLFSRFTGTPPAVSALLSQVIAPTKTTAIAKGAKPVRSGFLKPGSDNPGPVVALFVPWPQISGAITFERRPGQSTAAVALQARESFRSWLRGHRIKVIDHATEPRGAWQLAFGLERQVSSVAFFGSLIRSHKPLKGTWNHMVRTCPAVTSLSSKEADILAEWLLGAPGAVTARAVMRHDPKVFDVVKTGKPLLEFCWRQLRPYLASRHFADLLRGPRRRGRGKARYPDALREAIIQGGFEAVLDEHLAVMTLIGDDTPVGHLRTSLVSPGRVRMRRRGGAHRTDVHVAMPFTGAKRKDEGVRAKAKSGGKGAPQDHRSDALRGAFNSPFWPHVLCTTSVGQEGLDFHVWCDRVIHWDLPRDPVDFEQREGRIARYGSLCVRRALAQEFPDAPGRAAADKSPFERVFQEAREAPPKGLGLERWWCPTTDKPRRITFATPFSQSGAKLTALQDDLMRYRLGLGQPDPEQFKAFVQHFNLSNAEMRTLALNLSAWSARADRDEADGQRQASATGRC